MRGQLAFLHDGIVVYDLDLLAERRLTTQTDQFGRHVTWPKWSRDGSRIAFVVNGVHPAEVYWMDAARADRQLVTSEQVPIPAVSWSPGGNRMAWIQKDSPPSIVEYQFGQQHGMETRRVVFSPLEGYGFRGLSWAPTLDVDLLAFGLALEPQHPSGIDSALDGHLLVLRMGDRGARDLGADDGRYRQLPDWSPDGSKIAFVSTSRTDPDDAWLCVMRYADGEPQTLLRSQYALQRISWSPDGTAIALSTLDSVDSLIVVGVDDPAARQLTLAWAGQGDWGPSQPAQEPPRVPDRGIRWPTTPPPPPPRSRFFFRDYHHRSLRRAVIGSGPPSRLFFDPLWDPSPIVRLAVRVAIATLAGYLVANALAKRFRR